MTNEEAIRTLEFMKSEMLLSFDHDRKEALKLAISALEQLNNSNQEVKKSSDADRILKIVESAKDKNGDVPMSIVRKAFDKLLPSAQPESSTDIQDVLGYLDDVLHPLISPDNWNVYSELHDMISRLPSLQPDNQVHLCESCRYTYPDCPSKDSDVIFGNGKGNDNICACNRYLPSAQPEIVEQLYRSKCYVTDKEGLQHEVVHTGDIRRITGWEI